MIHNSVSNIEGKLDCHKAKYLSKHAIKFSIEDAVESF